MKASRFIRDTEGRPLEERPNDAMVVMQTLAAEVRRREIERQKEEERRRAEEEAARTAELARHRRQLEVEDLSDLAERWRHAEHLRAFIEAAVGRSRARGQLVRLPVSIARRSSTVNIPSCQRPSLRMAPRLSDGGRRTKRGMAALLPVEGRIEVDGVLGAQVVDVLGLRVWLHILGMTVQQL